MKNSSSAHVFSIFWDRDQLNALHSGAILILKDNEIVRRILSILRLDVGECIILFNKTYNLLFKIESFGKKEISLSLINTQKNNQIQPAIHWYLPLLEKEPFEEAISLMTILGVTTIQPVITQKVHRRILAQKDFERMHRIMISAAEQSKQFVIPEILPIISFDKLASTVPATVCIFFDPIGINSFNLIEKLRVSKPSDIVCMVGPEGDLTNHEKDILKQNSFDFYALTPTILRSQHAATIATGILRSLLC